jgi:hypothetical protein
VSSVERLRNSITTARQIAGIRGDDPCGHPGPARPPRETEVIVTDAEYFETKARQCWRQVRVTSDKDEARKLRREAEKLEARAREIRRSRE